ncbi:leucyl aminopeptidase [Desulfuromonas thiophila]|uniref:leucyl aminopeptidase n=1 Tax=Desulfuromonas thiophila TaxID=57664 RepID=UPI0029F4F7C3|nr:leucyl aminopeptidase [Desulfuromonas thiophila]
MMDRIEIRCDMPSAGWQLLPLTAEDWSRVATGPALAPLAAAGLFRAEAGEGFVLPAPEGAGGQLVLGLAGTCAADWRRLGAEAAALGRSRRLGECWWDGTAVTDEALIAALLDGFLLEGYRFERYRQPAAAAGAVPRLTLVVPPARQADCAALLRQRLLVAQGVTLARDLVNEPGNVKTPQYLAEQAWQLARQTAGVRAMVYGPQELRRQGCGALLAVAQGSAQPPCLIVLEYRGGNAETAPLALVGKAVTFDSGGISLKPSENMEQMKMDMAGGAVALATLITAARLQLPVNLVAVIPAVENMPSGSAQRPGDIVRSLSGQTIEVVNTDAEGRLILADALTFASRLQPRAIIDIATLTGACIIALGHQAAALLGRDETLLAALRQAGERSGERLWPLPLLAEYNEQIKSTVADLKNSGGRPAGTITAAAFLGHFAATPAWAHLDIAGTAWEEKGRPGQPVGATGFGVRLLLDYLQQGC